MDPSQDSNPCRCLFCNGVDNSIAYVSHMCADTRFPISFFFRMHVAFCLCTWSGLLCLFPFWRHWFQVVPLQELHPCVLLEQPLAQFSQPLGMLSIQHSQSQKLPPSLLVWTISSAVLLHIFPLFSFGFLKAPPHNEHKLTPSLLHTSPLLSAT